MTDLVLPDHQPTTGVDLEVFARQAVAAATYAEAVCHTQMVPQAYRNKPEEATAAILAGAELGFGPMASLRAFHPINGTPAPAAITLRAVVTGQGHDVEVVESNSERAVVSGRRKGTETWQTSIWDIARAQLMPQYEKNPNYKNNPAAMLVARATAEVCRWIASDAIMGMPYAVEELDDIPPAPPAPVARRLTVADLDTPPETIHTDGVEMVGNDQHRHMHALWRELGYAGDANRDTRLAIMTKILDLEHLASSKDLTHEQANKVITALRERKARLSEPAPDADQ